MKTTLLEWYDNRLSEANLGMNSKIKKRQQEASVEDEVERVGSAYIDFSGKNQEEILASLIDQAKKIYNKENNIKLAKSWNQIHTKVCLSVSFKQYVDQMNIAFSPRLYIAIDEDRHVDMSLDFRIDTSGSGNFNSRYIPLASGQIEETNEEIYNAMLNVRKLNRLDGTQYPSEWSKREYTKFVSGFTTSSWIPPIVASSDFNSKTIDEWMMLPAYCDGKFFNYDKALEDMLGQDIEYEVYKYKKLTPALEPYVKYKRRYRQELEGNIFRASVIVKGKRSKELIYDLGLRLYVYSDSSYKGFFTDVNSYYRLEDNGNIIYPEQDPKLMELVTKVDVESELFKIVKHKISHYITSNKNSTIVKNAKKRILSILANENKVNESNLGINNKIQKKFDKVDAVDNVAYIKFEDPEVERICHDHGVYTLDDAAKVTSIRWFSATDEVKTFNEFKYFTGLKDLKYPAFTWCRYLRSIELPKNISSIDNYSFYGCLSLESVNIPNKVTKIGQFVFDNCSDLKTIYISKNHKLRKLLKKKYPDISLIDPNDVNESNLGLNNKVKKKYGVETLEKTEEDIAHDFTSVKSTLATILTEVIRRSLDSWYIWFGEHTKIVQIITPLFDGRPSTSAQGVMEIIMNDEVPTIDLRIEDESETYELSDQNEETNKITFDNCMQILFNFTEYILSQEYDFEDTDGFDNFIAMHKDDLHLMTDVNKRQVIIDLLGVFGLLD